MTSHFRKNTSLLFFSLESSIRVLSVLTNRVEKYAECS